MDKSAEDPDPARSPEARLRPHGPSDAARERIAPVPGDPASIASAWARLDDATQAEDSIGEREWCIRLAKMLASKGTDLGRVVELARRAIQIADDGPLRTELSSWLSGFGEPRKGADELLAAAELARDPRARAKTMTRAAVLMARAGDAATARATLETAADLDVGDPIPKELLGTMTTWAPDEIPNDEAALAYTEAAKRRERSGDAEGAFEDLLRGFEIAPEVTEVARTLMSALRQRRRGLAADEVLRAHASELPSDEARAIAIERFDAALGADDLALAVSAIVDGDLLRVESDALRTKVEESLARAGLYELIAAGTLRRLRDDASIPGPERSRLFGELAKLYLGPLDRREGGLTFLVEAAVADPENQALRNTVRDHDSPNYPALVEALVRIASSDRAPASAVRELAHLAEVDLGDPVLSLWAYDRLDASSEVDRELRTMARDRHAPVKRQKLDEVARLSALVGGIGDGPALARVDALTELSKLYASQPDQRERYAEVLGALIRAEPAQRANFESMRRLVRRDGGEVGVVGERLQWESILRARLEAPLERSDRIATRLELVRLLATSSPPDPLTDAEAERLLDDAEGDALIASALLSLPGFDRGVVRARALVEIGSSASNPIRACLAAIAAEDLHRVGAHSLGRRFADVAVEANPESPRAQAILSRIAGARGDADGPRILERAMGLVVPSGLLCDHLATALETAGEGALAYAWTQRWLALAPSSERAVIELLKRAVTLEDPSRLADALVWVLAQPRPLDSLTEPFVSALSMLFSLDAIKAAPVARRALDVFGPHHDAIRDGLLSLSKRFRDPGLAIAVLERIVATSTEPPSELLRDLAVRRLAASDLDGAARELVRLTDVAHAPDEVIELADKIADTARDSGRTLSSDGRLWITEARARALFAIESVGQGDAAVSALRELAGLRVDLAADYRSAEVALFAAHDARGSFEGYVADVFDLAGIEHGLPAVGERAEAMDRNDPRRANLLLAAARVASENGLTTDARDLAVAAIELDPSHAEAVAIVESCAQGDDGARAIDVVYDRLADAAMGVYGRRAAHYRAARQLEARGFLSLALKHAMSSFEAVPNEGTSWTLLMRLVERTGDPEEAVRVIERVAGSAENDERAQWLKKAAALTSDAVEGLRLRFDLLLRALLARADSTIVSRLGETAGALVAADDDVTMVFTRLERAFRAIIPKLEGPDGAFVSIRMTKVLGALSRTTLAFEALSKAVELDAGHDAYVDLPDSAAALSADRDGAGRTISAIEKTPTTGLPLLRFAQALAKASEDPRAEALAADIARREADDRAHGTESFSLGEDDPTDAPAAPPEAASTAPVTPAAPEPSAPAPSVPPASAAPEASVPPTPPIHRRTSSAPKMSVVAVTGSFVSVVPLSDRPPKAASAPPSAPRSSPGVVEELAEDELGEADPVFIAGVLSDRIAAAESPEDRRILRLRRATLLEHRLDKPAEARAELESLLLEFPDDRSVLSVLADVLSRRGEPAAAAPLWEKLRLRHATSDTERRELGLKAARGFLSAKDGKRALAVLDSLSGLVEPNVLTTVRVDAARIAGDPIAILSSIDTLLAESPGLGEPEQARLLVEASRAALASGDESAALVRLRRAKKLDPQSAHAVIEACRVEYRVHGTGTPRDAQVAVEALTAIESHLPPDLIELHSFLLAEELDVIQGGGAGMRELTHRHATFGPLPLIALGMAERLVRNRAFDSALPLFERALEGDLHGLRSRGRVALAAADAAISVGKLEMARRLVEEAASAPETRTLVDRRRKEILAGDANPDVARPALEELVLESSGPTRARFLERLARLNEDFDADIAIALYEEALSLVRTDRHMIERLRDALVRVREAEEQANVVEALLFGDGSRSDTDAMPPPAPSEEDALMEALEGGPERSDDAEGDAEEEARAEGTDDDEQRVSLSEMLSPNEAIMHDVSELNRARDEARADAAAPEVEPPAESPPALETPRAADVVPSFDAPPSSDSPVSYISPSTQRFGTSSRPPGVWPTIESEVEEELFLALLSDSYEAGDSLLQIYGDHRGRRNHDVLLVRRQQALLRPGNRTTLEHLLEAAEADGNAAYRRSVEHVLAVNDDVSGIAPPDLDALQIEPELLQNVLFRDVWTPSNEVLAIVWEAGLFRHDSASYRLSDYERVTLGQTLPVARAYAKVLPAFVTPRSMYFKPSSRGPVVVKPVLTGQPAVIVEGDLPNTLPELLYLVGAALVEALPEAILAFGESDANLRFVFEAVQAAFGPVTGDAPPPSIAGENRAQIARLGADLWQRVSPRAERRLRELTEHGVLSIDDARLGATRARHRAGLFACGDLSTALRHVIAEKSEVLDTPLSSADGLEIACLAHPELADVVRFSLRSEYAEARFRGRAARRPGNL